MSSVATREDAPAGVALIESEIWFTYRGRIGVGQYWGRFLGAIAGLFIVAILAYRTTSTGQGVEMVDAIFGIASLFSIWPSTALASKPFTTLVGAVDSSSWF